MTCDVCKEDGKSRLRCVADFTWACKDCQSRIEFTQSAEKKSDVFAVIPTENFKYYYKNGGNVSRARIEMIKSRRICPDGNGEVVTVNKFGKYTDRKAVNY